ncbi:hypothetical protein HPB52_016186 [Rhipicephalus sanguineus]|uniref:Uncharacterized protein n=1 Tax=Rhipicephalus sanguineus TaxID=34632 RepID=A0A9D4PEP8_RHISA|nr:hypothetical protein HPB52_016186 [Rhipicephalus sanguineus]
MPPYTYVCTVAEPVRNTPEGLRLFLPPESTCDYVFYDSLYKDGKNNILDGFDNLDIGVRSFISVASKRNSSRLGFSFAPEPLFMREFEDPVFLTLLDVFWDYNIHHFGFLNLYQQYADGAMVTQALNALKEPDTTDTDETKSATEVVTQTPTLIPPHTDTQAATVIQSKEPEVQTAPKPERADTRRSTRTKTNK